MSKTNKTINRSEKYKQDVATGSGAMNVTFDPEGSCRIIQVNLHLDVASATSENMLATLDSDNGTEYDVKIITKDMDTIKDLILTHYDLGDFYVFEGDVIVFNWTNTNARTWGLEVIYRSYK